MINSEEMKNMSVQYYKELLTSTGMEREDFVRECLPSWDATINERLVKDVSMEETTNMQRGMGSYKASGPDGYQAVFFKKTWHLIAGAVHTFDRKVTEDGEMTLALIPKETKPSSMRWF